MLGQWMSDSRRVAQMEARARNAKLDAGRQDDPLLAHYPMAVTSQPPTKRIRRFTNVPGHRNNMGAVSLHHYSRSKEDCIR